MPLSGERTKGQEIHDFAVLTSAALPWMTGPSFISLWHACGLATLGYRVVYVLPWLDEVSQQHLTGKRAFQMLSEDQQEQVVNNFKEKNAQDFVNHAL